MEYKTKILEIGSLVPAFEEENLVVLFGPSAPNELRDISIIHSFDETFEDDFIKKGTKLYFNNQEYTVTTVGSAANANFQELGHISVYFGGKSEDLLPGAISVEPAVFPSFNIGEVVKFEN